MEFYIIGLLISLAIILVSCELFTNGIEWMGKMLKLGDGVVGSIFSAVGTCLPETMIPIIAILFSGNSNESVDVGIGAILGAPFMLSTLAFFITGFSVLVFRKRRKSGMRMQVNHKILKRDIGFFIVVYALGISAAFIDGKIAKMLIAALLPLLYLHYVLLTVRGDKQSHGSVDVLYLQKYLNLPPTGTVVGIQIILALAGIVFGAELFVGNLQDAAHLFGISTLVLSLIITPIATELPEKFNSIIWIAKKKDTLALGNITGAMVFQSCIPVSIGILATSWTLDGKAIISAIIAIASASVTYLWLAAKEKLTPVPLLAGGVFYGFFILLLARIYF